MSCAGLNNILRGLRQSYESEMSGNARKCGQTGGETNETYAMGGRRRPNE